MAIEFARARYVSRSDGGNACRSAAYNARSDVHCRRTGERFYFAHRDGLLHHEILLPDGAADRFLDAETLWNEAQAMERRKDSQEAREVLLALPCDPEIGIELWKEMCQDFAREHFVSKGVAVQIDIHAPHDGDVNVHAHLLITTRRIEGDRFSAAKARDLDPEIRTMKKGQKAVTEGERWGALWKEFQNRTFERLGLELRVDETSLVPQRHEGPVRFRAVPADADERLAATALANEAAARDPEWIVQRLTERRATFSELDIERLIRKHIWAVDERTAVRKAVLARPDVIALHERETGEFTGLYTTTEVRTEEKEVLAAAGRISQSRRAVSEARSQRVAQERGLDEQQAAAFAKATGTDGFVVIEGLAGAGKSHSLNAIREAHERSGWNVIGLAPTNVVAEDLRRSGFRRGSTAHLELFYQESGRHDRVAPWDRKTLVMVEEAAMLDTRIYARLMRRAAETGAKVILAGDDRQLSSVSRGGMFTALKERHGSVVISKVRRQQEEWQRTASEDFAEGRMAEGLRAYAEQGHVHWSQDIEESEARLLSDWDQASRERPEVNRFVYASTNVEVNRLNRAIRDIRVNSGEIEEGIAVETVRGKINIGAGDRLQFHGNDRKAGIYNGSLGTVTERVGTMLTVLTDTNRVVRFNAAEFDQFGLGYAGTIYRGQGKTQTEVYALYDNIFAWNARTAYVGLTRHRANVELYVSRDLVADEIALGTQMSRQMRDEASLNWATRAEIIELDKSRDGRGDKSGGGKGGGEKDKGGGSTAGGAPTPKASPKASPAPAPEQAPEQRREPLPREEVKRLRELDLTLYAVEVHGFTATADTQRGPNHFVLTRAKVDGRAGGGEDRLQAMRASDGRWIWRNIERPMERGDILDLARREGAADLRAAREAVAAWAEGQSMAREPGSRKRQAEDTKVPEIDPADPAAAAKLAAATDERSRAILGAEHEDRVEGIAADEEERLAGVRTAEAAAIARMDLEAKQVRDAEQIALAEAMAVQPRHHAEYVAALGGGSESVRQSPAAEAPTRRTGTVEEPEAQPIGIPTPAQLRYTEALAEHYDARDPYGSLAQTSLAESATWMRERHELDRRIAAETDPARRDALMLRRDIEHADYQAQAHDRIAGLSRAMGGEAHDLQAKDHAERAQTYRAQAAESRRAWEERGIQDPALYPALDPAMEQRRELARAAKAEAPEIARPAPDQKAVQPRTPDEERLAMSRLNLPEHAEQQHGYTITWRDEGHTRAMLHKGDEQLRASQAKDGTWSYESRGNPNDRGDILDFEARRGARTYTAARENLRPTLEQAEQERGPLHVQPAQQKTHGPEHDGLDHDPDGRRKGRGR